MLINSSINFCLS